MNILKEYINKKLLLEAVLSFILGLIIITITLTTNSESCIRLLFLIISLIAAILSYILPFNQKNIKNILYNTLLSDDFVGLIIPWSFLLELIFLELKHSIEYIFTHFTWPYLIITYFIISGIILSLMVIIDKYIDIVNKNIEHETQKNAKNIMKWLILSSYSFMFSAVYFSTKIPILYLTGRIIISIILLTIFIPCLIIFLYIYFRIHKKIIENINKKNLGNIFGNILAAYSLLSLVIYLIAEKSTLIIAMIYMALSIILPLIAIKYINKKESHSNSNLMSKK